MQTSQLQNRKHSCLLTKFYYFVDPCRYKRENTIYIRVITLVFYDFISCYECDSSYKMCFVEHFYTSDKITKNIQVLKEVHRQSTFCSFSLHAQSIICNILQINLIIKQMSSKQLVQCEFKPVLSSFLNLDKPHVSCIPSNQ